MLSPSMEEIQAQWLVFKKQFIHNNLIKFIIKNIKKKLLKKHTYVSKEINVDIEFCMKVKKIILHVYTHILFYEMLNLQKYDE